MKYLKVNLWGREIGRLVIDAKSRRIFFAYNGEESDIPDIAPLLAPASRINTHLPIYGDERPIYQGLPPFIADSLPDSWGNTLFDNWVKCHKVPRNMVTPLYKLMFIGSRGMGALEYEPAASDFSHPRVVDVNSLYQLSLNILDDREKVIISDGDALTLQALLAAGTSAGGRQIKAILAINRITGEIRSGQTDIIDDYDYYILKFGSAAIPLAEIEITYYQMAQCAGIDMEESRILPVEGINHFLTRRFDRKSDKVHIQTLAAMNPEARSYEDIFSTCRELSLNESELYNLYLRMVFNVMANNTDDHNKNFSFMLERGRRWQLAPAYDMTFIFNDIGNGPNAGHRMSICGKTHEITKSDLLEFARLNDIKNPEAAIDKVAKSLDRYTEFADKNHIPQPWRSIIQKTLDDTLIGFGYKEASDNSDEPFYDNSGREISNFKITINSKGTFEISANIDGNRRRRFIRKSMPEYQELLSLGIYNIPMDVKLRFIKEMIWPN